MNRWHDGSDERKENKQVDAFIEDLFKLYEKHGMSISHEDYHGGFKIDVLDDYNKNWIKQASVTEELEEKTENANG